MKKQLFTVPTQSFPQERTDTMMKQLVVVSTQSFPQEKTAKKKKQQSIVPIKASPKERSDKVIKEQSVAPNLAFDGTVVRPSRIPKEFNMVWTQELKDLKEIMTEAMTEEMSKYHSINI